MFREVVEDLWRYFGRDPYIVLITTNGTLKKNGKNPMGRGCAAEARLKISGIERLVGANIQTFGNKMLVTENGWGTFPVKHQWWEPADPELIVASANDLKKLAESATFRDKIFILGRPGCGNGKLHWSVVGPLLRGVGLPDNVWIISRSIL